MIYSFFMVWVSQYTFYIQLVIHLFFLFTNHIFITYYVRESFSWLLGHLKISGI